jgi:hypothetical protein
MRRVRCLRIPSGIEWVDGDGDGMEWVAEGFRGGLFDGSDTSPLIQ